MTNMNPFVALDDFELAGLYHTECMRFCACENGKTNCGPEDACEKAPRIKAIEEEALTSIARQWLMDRSPPYPFPCDPDNPAPATFAADPDNDVVF